MAISLPTSTEIDVPGLRRAGDATGWCRCEASPTIKSGSRISWREMFGYSCRSRSIFRRADKISRTSVFRAIFPIRLSRASSWHDSSNRDSASKKSPSPKSSRSAASFCSLDQVRRNQSRRWNSALFQQCSKSIEEPYRQLRTNLLNGRGRIVHYG